MDRTSRAQRVLVVLTTLLFFATPVVGDEGDERPTPTAKGKDERTVGWVLIPTAELTRNFMPIQTRGIAYDVVDVNPGLEFELQTTDSSSFSMCSAGTCVTTGDFDITFFHERDDGSTTVTGRYTDVGSIQGTVPPDSDYAFVYLKTPGFVPTMRGFEFEYIERIP